MLEGEQAVAVVEGGDRVVDGARADDDEEAVQGVIVLDYVDGFVTRFQHGLFGGGGLEDFVLQEVRRCERVIAADWRERGRNALAARWNMRMGGASGMYFAILPNSLCCRHLCFECRTVGESDAKLRWCG